MFLITLFYFKLSLFLHKRLIIRIATLVLAKYLGLSPDIFSFCDRFEVSRDGPVGTRGSVWPPFIASLLSPTSAPPLGPRAPRPIPTNFKTISKREKYQKKVRNISQSHTISQKIVAICIIFQSN